MDEKNKLLTALHNSLNYYSQISKAFYDLQNARSQLQQTQNKAARNTTPTGAIILVAVISFFLVIVAPYAVPRELRNGFTTELDLNGVVQNIGLISSIVLAVLILPKSFKKLKEQNTMAIQTCQMRIKQIEDFIFNHYVNFCDSEYQVMPYVYCNPETIRQFIFYIESCRADTIKEAVNCYVNDANTAMARQYQLLTLSAAQQAIIEARWSKRVAAVGAVASILSNFK